MPIIAASEVDQSGTSITAATTPTSEALTPRPTSATRIGSPAATTEPKTSSRMIAAAAMPMPSEPMSPWVAVCDHLAAERDLHARPVRGLGQVDDPLGVLDRHRVRVRRVELDRGVHDPAVRRDRALLPVRAGGGDDVRDGGDPAEQAVHGCPHGRVGHPAVGPDHDVDLLAGRGREPLGQQVLGGPGIRPAGGVVGLEVAGRHLGEADRGDDRGQPEHDDQHASAVRGAGEPAEHPHLRIGNHLRLRYDASR